MSESVRRTERLLSEKTPVDTGIHALNRKGWHCLCCHVRGVLQALLEYYDSKDDTRRGHRTNDLESPLAILEEFDKKDNPLHKLLGQPEQGYIRRFGDRLKPQPRNAVRDRIDSMRIHLDWCCRVDLGDGLALESNGVPVALPTHSQLALWPDQLLTIFYEALAICYRHHIMKLGATPDTRNITPDSGLADSLLLYELDESRTHYDSTTSRVDGTDLIEALDGRVTARVVIRLPKTTIEADQGSRIPSIFYVPPRVEQPQLLHNAQSAALSQAELLRLICNSQRGSLEKLHREVQRLTLKVDWKEEEIKGTASARRQLAQEHDHLKEELTMLKADKKNVELSWQEMSKRRDKERELRMADILKLAKSNEDLQISQNRNEILSSHVDRLEAQLKETEAAWSRAAQECDLLKAEIERLGMEKGKAVPLDRSEPREGIQQLFLERWHAANRPPLRNIGPREWPNVCDGWDNSQTDIREE